MTLEEMTNYDLLQLYTIVVLQRDLQYADEIREEIFSRMEVEGTN